MTGGAQCIGVNVVLGLADGGDPKGPTSRRRPLIGKPFAGVPQALS